MKQAILTVDLSYGDTGKGTIVDALVRETGASLVVRSNGGAQAAHTVCLPDGRQHIFSQFGSGTLVPGTYTYLSKHTLVNPLLIVDEAKELEKLGVEDPMDLMRVDGRCLMTTPYHRAMNRLLEIARGAARHGSCGMGIGETMRYWLSHPSMAPRINDVTDAASLSAKLLNLRDTFQQEVARLTLPRTEQVDLELSTLFDDGVFRRVWDRYIAFGAQVKIVDSSELLHGYDTVVFESAQGVLLDEWHGFHPYTTWSTTTLQNAYDVLREVKYTGPLQRIGIMRAYMTRHGRGPFPTEDAALAKAIPDLHNKTNDWQHGFRVGWLDLPATRYALAVVGQIDALAITNLDRIPEESRYCAGYSNFDLQPNAIPDLSEQVLKTECLAAAKPIYKTFYGDPVDTIEKELKLPIGIVSYSPTHEGKHFRNPVL